MSLKTGPSTWGTADGGVVRSGYLKKLKTSRKKWFVLRGDTRESPARLDYYDSEKKFLAGVRPKRSIMLKTCFNINRRTDTKYKHVIALYTKVDCFCVVLDSEEELDAWLKPMLSFQHGEDVCDGEILKPTFEHIWQVKVQSRGLGGNVLLSGGSRYPDVYRLCLTDKTITLVHMDDLAMPKVELPLSCIRRCGNLKNYFYLDLGRSCSIGSGELWLDTEDPFIADNIHQTVCHAMSSSNSSSKEELNAYRHRSSSATESSRPSAANRRQTHSGVPKPTTFLQDAPRSNESLAQHVPASSSARTTAAGSITFPGLINHQRTQSLPLENPAPLTTDHSTPQPPRNVKTINPQKCLNSSGRERCDSMPSRPRTTSEGNHPPWNQRLCHAQYRPHSLHCRDISHSPPSGSPVSPPSAPCSTDSAGSSLSIDDSEAWPETETLMGRYGNSLTPDEAIAEIDERPDSPLNARTNMSSDDGYVDMISPHSRLMNMSPAASTSSVTSGTPSTDMRFAEYHLEKVSSYFAPSEEEESGDRPIRAYSVGSRPETYKNNPKSELSTTPENSRVRAFSVGSRTKKIYNRILHPHSAHQHPGVKSSSAPILTNSRLQGSHDKVDYLMEVDFSRINGHNNNHNHSAYMEMKPSYRTPSGYVDMKPGSRIEEVNPYVDMSSGSSPAKSSFTASSQESFPFIDAAPPSTALPTDYMDMNGPQKTAKPASKLPSFAPAPKQNEINPYMDMNVIGRDRNTLQLSTSPVKGSVSPKYQSSPSPFDYMDMDYHARNARTSESESVARTPDGYVEMTLGKQKGSNSDSNKSSDDYISMTGKKKEKKQSKKDRVRSQPIAIQPTTNSNAKTSGGSPLYATVCRKFSTGTPPKMFLPLSSNASSYSSLPRQKSRKNSSRRDSKDSSSSSVTTPSSSSTIFPISINSPCSPIKPPTTQPSPVPNRLKPWANCSAEDDYTMMDFEKPKKAPDTSEYINFSPAEPKPGATAPIAQINDEFGEYAIMKPGKVDQTPSKRDEKTLGFRPISEGKEDSCSPKPGDLATEKTSESSESAKSSRPGSTSSEMGSSTSTLVGSRPNSVNSDQIRPTSVEIQLHYASLDLVTRDEETGSRSPRTVKNAAQNAAEGGGAQQPQETGFMYAEIDFIKSEGLKQHGPLPTVKH